MRPPVAWVGPLVGVGVAEVGEDVRRPSCQGCGPGGAIRPTRGACPFPWVCG